MELRSLPQRPRPQLPVALLHVLHGAVVAALASALLLNGLYLLQQPGQAPLGRGLVVLVLMLMVAEAALMTWLFLRRRSIRRQVERTRGALLSGDALGAELALRGLLEYWEYRLDPGPVCYGLGLAALLRGDTNAALELLRRAGSHRASLELRALLMLELGMLAKASRVVSVLFGRWPSLMRTWLLQAAVLQRSGRREEARRLLADALERRPRAGLLRRALELVEADEDVLELLGEAKPRLEA